MKYTWFCLAISVQSVLCIVNGTNANDPKGIISLQTKNGYKTHFCSGALLEGEKRVITAASCVDKKRAQDIRVVGGITRLSDSNDGFQMKVDRILRLPDDIAGKNNVRNNIAILCVTNISEMKKLSNIELPDEKIEGRAGTDIVRGWGSTSDHNWTRHISGFDVMKPGPSNTLLAWVGGRGALEMEKLTDSQVIHDCIALLAQFTKSQVPAPIKYYCTRWYSNPFVRGAYSYISTDCDKNGTSSQLLSKPITVADLCSGVKELSTQFAKNLIMPADLDLVDNQKQEAVNDRCSPLILFAGEACHQQYFSTAHGAFLSGIEQAEKILNFCEK